VLDALNALAGAPGGATTLLAVLPAAKGAVPLEGLVPPAGARGGSNPAAIMRLLMLAEATTSLFAASGSVDSGGEAAALLLGVLPIGRKTASSLMLALLPSLESIGAGWSVELSAAIVDSPPSSKDLGDRKSLPRSSSTPSPLPLRLLPSAAPSTAPPLVAEKRMVGFMSPDALLAAGRFVLRNPSDPDDPRGRLAPTAAPAPS
jgi:hypothetical protein